jgi:type II secretory pathway component PulF
MSDFTASGPAPKPSAPLTADDLATLNDEIAAMARAGLPLDQGLAHLAKEMGSGRLQQTTAALADDMRRGKTLPEALAAQENRLPPFYASLVTAGIRSGRLGDVLATLTAYARALSELRATVINSLIYPFIILVMGFGLVMLWILYVGPQFRKIYDDFKLRLPVATEVVLHISDHPYLYFVAPVACLVVGFVALRFWFSRDEAGRLQWARFIYSIPLVGTLVHSARLAAFVDLLAILVEHKVPLSDAFRLAAGASSDPLVRVGARTVCENLDRGQPLAASLRDVQLVPDFLAWMAGMGERNQRLGETLRQTAEFYRKQAEARASLFRTVFPAVALIVVAVIVIAIVMGVMLAPMFGLLDGLSGGSR